MVFMLLLPLGLGFFLGLLYLALSPIRRQRVTHKLNALSGSISAGWTPSERWPSEKRKDGREASPSPEYRDAYPPSTRPSLAELVSALPPHQRERCQTIGLKQAKIRNAISPWGIGWEHWSPATCSPMGISLGEIRALGDFPDYAKLSGVPLPQAYPEFDINKARPRPYRPFRWAYHQTMALTKLEPDWWLELEQTYVARIRERMTLFAENGRAVLDYLPGSELACKELMEMCLQFICARYPHYFSLSQDKQVFYNEILKTETRLKELHPLHVLLRNVPEDFAIMLRNPDDGCYYFRAGVLCSALGWDVSTKIGLALHQIHEPVPDYKEKMRFSMDRYFSKLPTDRPIQRGSWGLEVDTPLFMPPGDPHEQHRSRQDPQLSLSRIHLRVDWQTLRRLPLSGAIVFNFKAVFTPVTEFQDEPYVPHLLRKVLLQGKSDILRYKATWHVQHVILPVLESWEREQVQRGWVERDWEVGTLQDSPWFPGWRDKWRRQQGF